MNRGSAPIAIDPTQAQRLVLDRARSRLAEEASQGGPIAPGQGAARFEQLMEAPDPAAGPPAGGSVAEAPSERVLPGTPAGRIGDVASRPATAGDRILANLSQDPVQAPAQAGPPAADPPGASPAVDIGRPMDRLELQMQVAEIRAKTGLAVSATQKATQGVDTLLKSQ